MVLRGLRVVREGLDLVGLMGFFMLLVFGMKADEIFSGR